MELKLTTARHAFISTPNSLTVKLGCSDDSGDSIEITVAIESTEAELKSMSLSAIEAAAVTRAKALMSKIIG